MTVVRNSVCVSLVYTYTAFIELSRVVYSTAHSTEVHTVDMQSHVFLNCSLYILLLFYLILL